jgi:hypothetical protein
MRSAARPAGQQRRSEGGPERAELAEHELRHSFDHGSMPAAAFFRRRACRDDNPELELQAGDQAAVTLMRKARVMF